ncbi:ABC transporter permease, partial [Listeria monocytogenes]
QESMSLALGGEEISKVDAEPFDKIDGVINSYILGQVGGLGFIFIFLATTFPCFFIIRLQPILLFTLKD